MGDIYVAGAINAGGRIARNAGVYGQNKRGNIRAFSWENRNLFVRGAGRNESQAIAAARRPGRRNVFRQRCRKIDADHDWGSVKHGTGAGFGP